MFNAKPKRESDIPARPSKLKKEEDKISIEAIINS
jgi:hypothetical protein